jgi:hypothetical protein
MKQPLNHANHFAMLLMALAMAFAFLACGNKVQKDVPSWPQMSVDKFGCMMEETFGYRHEIFNCSLKGYENNPDPCNNEFYDSFHFPDSLAKKVHPMLSKINLYWQQGKLQGIYLYFDASLGRLTYEEKLKSFGLWNNQPNNIKSIDVTEDYLSLTGFVSISTRCIRDGSEEERLEERLKAEADCPDKKIGYPRTTEAVWLGSTCGDGCYANARLADGEEIILFCKDTDVIEMVENIKEGAKVSVTYQKIQRWNHDYFNPSESGCYKEANLQSVKLLPNGNEEEYDPDAECPSKTGPLQTAEATFLEISEGLRFRLTDGDTLDLRSDIKRAQVEENLRKGVMVSVTYTERQELDEGDCSEYKALESLTILEK